MDAFISQLANAMENLTDRLRTLEGGPRTGQSYVSILTNGGFESWTGGPGPFTISGACADSWSFMPGSGSAMAISQDTVNQDATASASCAQVVTTILHTSLLYQAVPSAPVLGTPMAISVRVKTDTPGAVRLGLNDFVHFSPYHTGSGLYETLVLVGICTIVPFKVILNFDASCTAYIDSCMAVQGIHPLDYIWTP